MCCAQFVPSEVINRGQLSFKDLELHFTRTEERVRAANFLRLLQEIGLKFKTLAYT